MNIMFELKMAVVMIVVILPGYCFGIVRVEATNTQKFTYQAPAEYNQAEEQRFRNSISQRMQELEQGR